MKTKRNAVWILVNDSRPLAVANNKSESKMYAAFFTTTPTTFPSYREARKVYMKQMRKYQEKLSDPGMGKGWQRQLGRWIQGLNIIRVPIP